MTRLIQSGLVSPHDLARKYASELHANEILLLAYYIAAVNIETVFQETAREQLDDGAYRPFEGLVLADTFQMYEDGDHDDLGVFVENNERVIKQRALPITVVVGNPPYSSGQDSANDDNANEKYTHLDAAIRDTYAAQSTATNKNSLYDSYIRAIKWASLRVQDRGVVAFVTNGGWLDSNTADGLRKSLAEEFSALHVFNLRGNARTAGEQRRKEAGNVFEDGGRTTIAIFLLVKDPTQAGNATVHYTEVDDYLTARQKLNQVAEAGSFAGLTPRVIEPNEHGDWMKQRSDDFEAFMPLGDKSGASVFGLWSGGVKTNRDAWCYNFSDTKLVQDIRLLLRTYEHERTLKAANSQHPLTSDSTSISWNRSLRADVERNRPRAFDEGAVRTAGYQPFTKQRAYFSRALNDMVYRQFELFPTAAHPNFGFTLTGASSHYDFCLIAADAVPDLHLLDTGQFFARWRYEKVDEDESTLFAAHSANDGASRDVIDGYRRIDNITNEGLAHFQNVYGDGISKDDILFYTYGLLHSPDYRAKYAADLKKMLPRIPLVVDPNPFIDAGRKLSDLHLGYESVQPYPLQGLDTEPAANQDPYDFYRVQKMAFGRPSPEQKSAGEKKDRGVVVVNPHLTLTGIPEEAHGYMLGSRSVVEWILERYQVKTDKASGIVNDPNDWSREVGDPRYIVDLLARIVTLSVETVELVNGLPSLDARADEAKTHPANVIGPE